jgi:ornithine cyclodeaminase/alanine dehydrogenase-like protein (mu-crystallin family)
VTVQPSPVTNSVEAGAQAPGVRLLDGDDVDALLSAELGLEAARASAGMVARDAVSSGRVQVGEPERWTRILVGLLPELDLLGYKQFHKIGKTVHYHVHLFRLSDGESLAILDGRRITGLRTSSTSACAIRHVFGDEQVTLALVGSGEEAHEGLRAVAAAVSLSGVRVFSPTPANREAFAAEMSAELDVSVVPATSVEEALEGANAAYLATTAQRPVLPSEPARGLRFVAAVGASRPDFRELEPELVLGAARVVVDCLDTLEESGDLVDATNAGWDSGSALLLGHFLDSELPEDGLVVFNSVGSVEQDLVLAERLLRAAEAEGRGRIVPPVASLRTLR